MAGPKEEEEQKQEEEVEEGTREHVYGFARKRGKLPKQTPGTTLLSRSFFNSCGKSQFTRGCLSSLLYIDHNLSPCLTAS